jgi:hypothetical protein
VLAWKAPNPEEIIPDDHPRRSHPAAAVLVALPGVALSAWRGQRAAPFDSSVPVAPDQPLPAGMFVGNVLPSTIGATGARDLRAGRPSPSDASAPSS